MVKIMFLKSHKNCQNIFLTSSRFLCFLLLWGFFFEQPIKVCMCSNRPITARVPACLWWLRWRTPEGLGDCVSHWHTWVKSICPSTLSFCSFKADLLLCWSTLAWNTATVSDNEVSNPCEQAPWNTPLSTAFTTLALYDVTKRGWSLLF